MAKLLQKAKKKTLVDYGSFVFGYYNMLLARKKLSRVEPKSSGVTEVKRETPIIVSLTSFPARIDMVSKCISTLLCQSFIPDKVILWLSKEQFPDGYDELPAKLLQLLQYGLEIGWCEDIRSYKKLIPTLKAYPDCIIVTADDDLLYDRNWLELLYNTYEANKNCIICHRITKVYQEGDVWRFIAGGKDIYEYPSYLNKLVGCGGVLYPPGVLNDEVFNEHAFQKLAPTNDDVWFWCMGILNGTRIMAAENRIRWNKEIKGAEKSALSRVNNEQVVREQFQNVLKSYPLVEERLLREILQKS